MVMGFPVFSITVFDGEKHRQREKEWTIWGGAEKEKTTSCFIQEVVRYNFLLQNQRSLPLGPLVSPAFFFKFSRIRDCKFSVSPNWDSNLSVLFLSAHRTHTLSENWNWDLANSQCSDPYRTKSLLTSITENRFTCLSDCKTISVSTAAVSRNLRDARQMVCVVSNPIGLTSLSDFSGTGNSSNRLSQTYGLHLCRLLPYHSN